MECQIQTQMQYPPILVFSESLSRHLLDPGTGLVIWYSGNGVRHVSSRRIALVMRGQERWNWSISKFRGDNSSCFGQTDVKLYFGRSRQQTTLCQDQILFWSEGCTEQSHWRFVCFELSTLFMVKTEANLPIKILQDKGIFTRIFGKNCQYAESPVAEDQSTPSQQTIILLVAGGALCLVPGAGQTIHQTRTMELRSINGPLAGPWSRSSSMLMDFLYHLIKLSYLFQVLFQHVVIMRFCIPLERNRALMSQNEQVFIELPKLK